MNWRVSIIPATFEAMKQNAVIYARVSSTGDRQSTTRQVADLISYAEKNDYIVVKIYEEHISGAKKNEERTVLLDCLDYCEINGIDCILVSELSRLGRNTDEVLAIVKRCRDSNLNVYFQKENLSLFLPGGSKNPFLHIFISVLSTCAEMERENIYFRLSSGRRQYIENGGKLGRKIGSVKTAEQKGEEYKQVIRELRRGTSVRRTAKLCDVSVSTVARIKKEFAL